VDAERLQEKAREYELNKLAAEERGDVHAALCFAAVAIALYELYEAELSEREAA
jgi:hypothetical protein